LLNIREGSMAIFTLPLAAAPALAGAGAAAAGGGGGGGGFSVSRIVVAVGVLALIFLAGVYCAHDPAMKDWSAPLLHTFELLLGGMVGIIVGEKTAAAP
jgi:hypothetical protein